MLVKDSYDDVLDAVRSGEVFAAVINSDIVQWRQSDIKNGGRDSTKPLAIAYKIDMTIPVRMNVHFYGNMSQVWQCLDQFRNEIVNTPQRKYFRYVEVRMYNRIRMSVNSHVKAHLSLTKNNFGTK